MHARTLRRVLAFSCVICALAFVLCRSEFAAGQDMGAGIPPFSVQTGGIYDKVDPATSRILITIPVRSKAGIDFSLVTNNHVATLPSLYVGVNATVSLTTTSVPLALNLTPLSCGTGCVLLRDPIGGYHPVQSGCNNLSRFCYSWDTSGWGYHYSSLINTTQYYDYANLYRGYSQHDTAVPDLTNLETFVTQITATNPDGLTVTESPDYGIVNGEYAYTTGKVTYTDTLGTTILTAQLDPYVVSSHLVADTGSPHGTPATYSWTDANGKPQAVTVNYSPYLVSISGWSSGGLGAPGCVLPPDSTKYLPSSVVMSTGERFTFGYEQSPGNPSGVTGRISKLTLPNGGSISYSYLGDTSWPDGVRCDGTVPKLLRTVTDASGHQSVWTYILGDYGPNNQPVSFLDPSGNSTVLIYNAGHVVGRQVYQGSMTASNLVSADQYCYNPPASYNVAYCTPPPATQPLAYLDAYHYSNNLRSISLTETTYEWMTSLPTEIKKWDYFSWIINPGVNWNGPGYQLPFPGGPSQITAPLYSDETIGYGTWRGGTSPCTSESNGMVSLTTICEDKVTDGTGALVKDVRNTYNAAGHKTSRSGWVTGTTYLGSQYSYNANGTMASATDVNGAPTYYYYNGAGGCNGLLLTSTTLPVSGLSTAQTWDCNGGVLKSSTDVDGKTTQLGYISQTGSADPMWRLRSTIDPLGNTTWTQYTPASASGPATQETSLSFASSTVDVLSTLDSLGRPYLTQVRQGPGSSSFDTSTTGYDANGRPASFSVPCTAGASATCGGAAATLNLDAANRPLAATDAGGGYINFKYTAYGAGGMYPDVTTSVLPAPAGEAASGKQEQLEYDAFDRLKSVCEMTSAAGSGNCAQGVSQTGYWTKYGYDLLGRLTSVIQNAQGTSQSRAFSYDGLGRLTAENEPESGLTQYFYDSAPSTPGVACPGTYNGDLVKIFDANGNTICYTYDGLHRKTSTTYSGPNSTGTNSYFVYDAATVNAVTMANTAGRLAEAYTATCSTCTKTTDLGFSYSVRGEPTDTYEATPNSAGYYHISATYYASGVLNTLSGVPGQATWTYGLDGEGRPTTLTQGTTTLVKSAAYDNAGSPTRVSYGNGDVDQYQYDSTERMKQYLFTVGTANTTVTGNLTWNQNGTLQSLGIVDGFNATNTQTCGYLYDDLVRLASANCPSIWTQSFTYDPFGNISKTGTSSFQAGYSTATNRISSLPGVTVTYDSNGNLTGDGTHTYKWDSENRTTQVDAKTMIYDGLGRIAEINSLNQILYGPLGKLGVMKGQTLTRIYIPLPGGERMEYRGSKFIHHLDWLGTARLITLYGNRTNSYDSAYAPFGENYAGLGTVDYDFTGQTEDTVSGTQGFYDFLYRKYSPVQSRWISPDPGGVNVVDPSHPQTWNAYAYLANNPLNNTDALGLDGCSDSGDGSGMVECSVSYNGSSGSWDSTITWSGGPFDSSGQFNPFWNLGNMSPGFTSGLGVVLPPPAPSSNTIFGQDASGVSLFANAKPVPSYGQIFRPDDDWWGTFFGNLSSHWSWGVRTQNQTYGQCLSQNSSNYSLAGALNQQGEGAQLIAGNDVASVLFGNASEGMTGLLIAEGASQSLQAGAGTALTFGRRTSSIFNLNLNGIRGGAQKGGFAALEKTGAKGAIATAAAYKLAADVGATIAMLGGCFAHP